MKIQNWILIILLACMGVTLISSCSTKQAPPNEEQRQEARLQVPCIVVLPVVTDLKADESMTYNKASVLEEGAAVLDQAIAEALMGHDNVRLLSKRQLTSLLPESETAQAALYTKIGKELNCNAVLKTTLSRYQQRVGGDYGVDSPASAMFFMELTNTADGSLIWSSTFRETQQSLMSNILSAHKYGLKWLKVEELVTMGVTEIVEQCPYL